MRLLRPKFYDLERCKDVSRHGACVIMIEALNFDRQLEAISLASGVRTVGHANSSVQKSVSAQSEVGERARTQ